MVDDGLLDSLRQTGDPLADAAVAEAVASGTADRLPDLLGSSHQGVALREYSGESRVLPHWADPGALHRGGALWDRYGAHLSTILHTYSLPVRYGWADAAQVRARGARAAALETSRFLRDVMADGGLTPDGDGVLAAQRIRLRNAVWRYRLRTVEEWPGAIGQEDLTAVMGTFSVCLPRGLARLGIDLPEADRDACFHIWSVVGYLLGVDPRLVPASYEEGVRLMNRIWQRRWAPSEAGTALAATLVSALRKVFGPGLRGAPPTLIRHFCGDALADLLAVPPAEWTALTLDASTGLSAAFGKTGDRGELLARVSSKAGELLLHVTGAQPPQRRSAGF